MRKLIDIDEATFKSLSHLAIEADTNLKSYIESILVLHARAGGRRTVGSSAVGMAGSIGFHASGHIREG